MAKLILNPLFAGLRGRVGGMILRTRNGQTYVSRRPQPHRREPTAAQLEQQARFRMATSYARGVLADPVQAAFYHALAREGEKPQAIAVRDFLRAPTVDDIGLGLFDGLAGEARVRPSSPLVLHFYG